MKTYDITPIIQNIEKTVATHKIADGAYARWLWQDKNGRRELGQNPYGCADAANILYTIGAFPRDPRERAAWVETLQGMQGEDGLFHESTHHFIHTTAHCAAALELFDASPARPCTALLPYLDHEKLKTLLDTEQDWSNNPWSSSHKGAGIFVALNLAGTNPGVDCADRAWNDFYFRWFWDNTDPETGMWMQPRYKEVERKAPPYYYMGGSFHYLFNHEYMRMPLRYPEKLIDSMIEMYDTEGGLPSNFGKKADFLEIDWVFLLTRAQRQTPHRFYDVRDRLEDFAEKFLDFWYHVDWEKNETVNDMHMLFGGVCGLAELQQTLLGKMTSDKPLKLVLDRRPFI